MIKKTIRYTDFNGGEVVEDHYFHLSQAELIELEMSVDGGFAETMKQVIADDKGSIIIREFKKIILMSYGQRSPDGRRFIKNDRIREEFESSEAYSTLFMELCTNAEAASEFVVGIIPGDLEAQAAKLGRGNGNARPELVDPTPAQSAEGDELVRGMKVTRKELVEMNKEAFDRTTDRINRGLIELVDEVEPPTQ